MILAHDSLSTLNIHNLDILCQHYLAILYHDIHQKTVSSENINETYGEILYPSIDKLLTAIEFSDQDVFIDYGSGLGKIVLQVFLKTPVKEAYGIEILEELYQKSLNVAQRLQEDLPEFFKNGRTLRFLQGNFLEILLTQATIALVNSTCFTPKLLGDLGKVIERTPNIHTVLSMRPIHTLRRLRFKRSIRVECSWDTALCYIYKE